MAQLGPLTTTIPARVELERLHALLDVQEIVHEYGQDMRIYMRGEADVDRDSYNSIKRKNYEDETKIFNLKAWPLDDKPSEQYLLKLGWTERVDLVAKTAMKDWMDAGWNYNDLDMNKATVVVDGAEWTIKYKATENRHNNTYLYIVLGLVQNR